MGLFHNKPRLCLPMTQLAGSCPTAPQPWGGLTGLGNQPNAFPTFLPATCSGSPCGLLASPSGVQSARCCPRQHCLT